MNEPALTPTLDSNSPTGIYIPADLDDCFRELDKMLPAVRIAGIRECEEVYLVLHHFGLSAWLRHSRLKRYFDGLGVYQAETDIVHALAAVAGREADTQNPQFAHALIIPKTYRTVGRLKQVGRGLTPSPPPPNETVFPSHLGEGYWNFPV